MHRLALRIALTTAGAFLGLFIHLVVLAGLDSVVDSTTWRDLITEVAGKLSVAYLFGLVLISYIHVIDFRSSKPRNISYVGGSCYCVEIPLEGCFFIGLYTPYYVLSITTFNYLAQVSLRKTDV